MKTDRQMLREYQLGTLPEDLAAEVDARLFADNGLHREIQDEQDSLIEDFVYGRLTPEEEAAFRTQCGQSPSLQEKVGSFRVFLSALERQSASKPSSIALRLPRFLFVLSPALALMLCVASFLYVGELRRNAILRSQVQSSSRRPNFAMPSNENKPVSVVAFLSANVPRGASSSAPEIRVPTTASVLELQVELHPAPVGEADWDAQLLRGREVVWASAHVPLHRIGQETFLSLAIETESIRAGSYVIRYSPHSDPEAAQFRPFHVVD